MPRTVRSTLRFAGAASLALLSAVALFACVDPKTDYDDYLARTVDADTIPVTTDDASFDGVSGDASGFQGQNYVMACVSQTLMDNPAEPTLFVATASFMPTDTMGDGTFNFTDTALVVGATNTTDLAGGAPTPVNGSTVTGGKVDVVFGPTTIPASADPLVGEGPIVFTADTLHVLIGPGSNLCATITGHTTMPLATDLTMDNFCIFFPFEGSTGQVPALTQDEFHCP
jgi:hypothetical protein